MNAELLAGNIMAHWLQAGAVVASALVALRVLHLNEPGARLAALQGTLVAILLLPVVQPRTPDEPAQRSAAVVTATDLAPVTSESVASASAGAAPRMTSAFAAVLLMVSGAVLRLIWLLAGVARLARDGRNASAISTPAVALPLEAELEMSARYILQAGSRGPWTFGFLRPTIALPAGFAALPPAFQRSVICHELVHVKRRDVVVAFCEELAAAALWFHPWMWLLRSRIHVAREQVVDRRAVAILGNRDEYVRCLVDLSGHDLAPHFSDAGARMLRPRELRARVDAIFREVHMSRTRVASAAFAFFAVVLAAGMAGAAAMPMRSPAIVDRAISIVLRPPEQASGTTATVRLSPAATSPINLQFTDARLRDVLAFIGHATSIVFTGYEESFDEGPPVTIKATIDATSPVEQLLDRLLVPAGLAYTVVGPRTVVIARHPQAQARSAPDTPRRQVNTVYPEYPQGALERGIQGTVVVDVTVNAAGDVTTAAVESGPQELHASALNAARGLKFSKGQSTVAIEIAIEYTLTPTSWGVKIGDAVPRIGVRPSRPMTGLRVEGDIRAPRKIKDVPPKYPTQAQEARVQGAVVLEARIDESGNVSDTRTLHSIPLLDQPAIDAVKQWQYEPTLLNGAAVPVIVTVTVSFTLRPLNMIEVVTPDGGVVALRADMPTQLVLGLGRFHLVPSRSAGSSNFNVSVYDGGQTHLGDVTLVPGGPVVQSPTTPSFGMRLIVRP